MILIAVLIAFVGLCILAVTRGSDSRFDRPGRQF